jgi:hypothetical protein
MNASETGYVSSDMGRPADRPIAVNRPATN